MQLNKTLKALMIAIPVLVMTACSSTDQANNGDQDTNNAQTNQNTQGNDGTNGSHMDANVIPLTPLGEQLTEQEIQQKALLADKTIFFAFDNATITPKYDNTLAAHAHYLIDHPAIKVTIEGHTDERGTPEYNIALGERRAMAVKKYLEALGVPNDQMSIVSYGEEKPLVLGSTPEAYAKNRRVVLAY